MTGNVAGLQPLLERGQIFSRGQLIEKLGVSRATFERWKAAGLQPLQTFTKCELYLSDELIAVWTDRGRGPRKKGL